MPQKPGGLICSRRIPVHSIQSCMGWAPGDLLHRTIPPEQHCLAPRLFSRCWWCRFVEAGRCSHWKGSGRWVLPKFTLEAFMGDPASFASPTTLLVLGFTGTVCCLQAHGATRDAAMWLLLLVVLVTHGALDLSLWVIVPCLHGCAMRACRRGCL